MLSMLSTNAKPLNNIEYDSAIRPFIEQTILHDNCFNNPKTCDEFKNFLASIGEIIIQAYKQSTYRDLRNYQDHPIIFISYAWFIEDKHPDEWWTQAFLLRFGDDLFSMGFDPRLDISHSRHGPSSSVYMENEIKSADFICPIGTRSMGTKLRGGNQFFGCAVRKEMGMIDERKRQSALNKDPDGVIPILLTEGSMEDCLHWHYKGNTVTESFQSNNTSYLKFLCEFAIYALHYFNNTNKSAYMKVMTDTAHPLAKLFSDAKQNEYLKLHFQRIEHKDAEAIYNNIYKCIAGDATELSKKVKQFTANHLNRTLTLGEKPYTLINLPETTVKYLSKGQDSQTTQSVDIPTLPFQYANQISKRQGRTCVEKVVQVGHLDDKSKRYNVPSITSSHEKARYFIISQDKSDDIRIGNKSRYQILQSMLTFFNTSQTDFFQSQVLVDAYDSKVLKGDGGVGKTVLAKLFARKQWDDSRYDVVCWIDATGNLEDQFSLILKDVFHIEEQFFSTQHTALDIVRSAYASLAQVNRWLLIFDNVENPEQIKPYLPDEFTDLFTTVLGKDNFCRHCLLTSRHSNFPGTDILEVNGFTLTEFKKYSQQYFENDYGDASLAYLANQFSYHPLGCVQAIQYLDNYRRKNNILLNISDYIESLKKTPYPVISNIYPKPTEYGWGSYSLITLKAIALSVQHLIDNISFKSFKSSKALFSAEQSSRLMSHILNCLAYLHRTAIPDILIQTLVRYATKESLEVNLTVQQVQEVATEICKYLVYYKIIEYDSNSQQITLHQIRHRVLQFQQFEDKNGQSLLLLLQALNEHFDYDPDQLTIHQLKQRDYQPWMNQVQLFLDYLVFPNNPTAFKLIFQLETKLGQYYMHELIDYDYAVYWLEKAETILNEYKVDLDREWYAKVYCDIAQYKKQQGMCEEGLGYWIRVLDLWEDSAEKITSIYTVIMMLREFERCLGYLSPSMADSLYPVLVKCINFIDEYRSKSLSLIGEYTLAETYYIRILWHVQCKENDKANNCIRILNDMINKSFSPWHLINEKLINSRIKVAKLSECWDEIHKDYSQLIELADQRGTLSCIAIRYEYRNLLMHHEHKCHAEKISQNIREKLQSSNKLMVQRDYRHRSVLHLATYNKDVETITWLLNQEIVKLDIDDSDTILGATPLFGCANTGDIESAILLLKQGAKVNCYDIFGRTPLYRAASGGFYDMCSLLLNYGAKVDSLDFFERSLLHYVATNNFQENIICLLLQFDTEIDINEPDYYGRTPLHLAVMHGKVKACEFLINHRSIEIDKKDKFGLTSLHYAVANSKFFHQKKVCVNKSYENTCHAFILASQKNSLIECIDLLLTKGTNANVKGNEDVTPLHLALIDGSSSEILQLLIKHGADLTSILQGFSATDLACLRENEENKKIIFKAQRLNDYTCTLSSSSISASMFILRDVAHPLMLKNMQDAGLNLSIPGKDGETWLIFAVKHSLEFAVKTLLNMDIDPSIPNAQGEYALHIAKEKGMKELVALIAIKLNAKRHMINTNGADGDITVTEIINYPKETNIMPSDITFFIRQSISASISICSTIFFNGTNNLLNREKPEQKKTMIMHV